MAPAKFDKCSKAVKTYNDAMVANAKAEAEETVYKEARTAILAAKKDPSFLDQPSNEDIRVIAKVIAEKASAAKAARGRARELIVVVVHNPKWLVVIKSDTDIKEKLEAILADDTSDASIRAGERLMLSVEEYDALHSGQADMVRGESRPVRMIVSRNTDGLDASSAEALQAWVQAAQVFADFHFEPPDPTNVSQCDKATQGFEALLDAVSKIGHHGKESAAGIWQCIHEEDLGGVVDFLQAWVAGGVRRVLFAKIQSVMVRMRETCEFVATKTEGQSWWETEVASARGATDHMSLMDKLIEEQRAANEAEAKRKEDERLEAEEAWQERLELERLLAVDRAEDLEIARLEREAEKDAARAEYEAERQLKLDEEAARKAALAEEEAAKRAARLKVEEEHAARLAAQRKAQAPAPQEPAAPAAQAPEAAAPGQAAAQSQAAQGPAADQIQAAPEPAAGQSQAAEAAAAQAPAQAAPAAPAAVPAAKRSSVTVQMAPPLAAPEKIVYHAVARPIVQAYIKRKA